MAGDSTLVERCPTCRQSNSALVCSDGFHAPLAVAEYAADRIAALEALLQVAVDAATVWEDGGDIAAVMTFEEWLPAVRTALGPSS